MLSYSQFNHMAQLPHEDGWALVNFAHSEVAHLDATEKALFDVATKLDSSFPLVKLWQSQGFLVEEGFDEVARLRRIVDRYREDFVDGTVKRSLDIVVCVTSACNFSCPYCFQDRRDGHMTPEVREALVHFVERRLASGRHDHLGVGWFGGEPLLAPEIIDDLSERLMSLAERFGVGYDAVVHTNGYLLDQEMVDFLEARNVRTAVVPIDGFGEAHDATRHLADGSPTFERIMGNLRSIRTSMFVNVRNNLNANSLERFEELCAAVDSIARNNGTDIRCSPSRVRPTVAGLARGDVTPIITDEQYEWALAKTDLSARLNAFEPISAPCPAALANEFHIDELGNLYPHCSFFSVDSVYSVGNLLDGTDDDTLLGALDDLIRKRCFPDEQPKCMACKFLPCCLGGCPVHRLETGEAECPTALFDPDSYAVDRCREAYGL